jgi:hypothetical protein
MDSVAEIVLAGVRFECKRYRVHLIELALPMQQHIVHRPPKRMHL